MIGLPGLVLGVAVIGAVGLLPVAILLAYSCLRDGYRRLR